ncbi:MAG: hypothetical protein MUP27_09140 [Desulfobacterales bacterium]|nr:hypothetical protein [Desulfobacterales bacterium]
MEDLVVKERFVDYLFDLYEGRIPKLIELMIERREDNVLYLRGNADVKHTAVFLGGKPYDCNMPCLGFALFGMFWATLLKGVDKMIKRRMKGECEMPDATNRFTRTVPIKPLTERIYFINCQDKASTRLTLQMCEGRQRGKRCPSKSCQYRIKDLIYDD